MDIDARLSSPVSAPRILSRPVLELIRVHLAAQVAHSNSHPRLRIGNGAVVDRRPNLLHEEIQQLARRQTTDWLRQVLLELALNRSDRILARQL